MTVQGCHQLTRIVPLIIDGLRRKLTTPRLSQQAVTHPIYFGFSAFMNEFPNLHKCVGLVGNAINGDFGFGFKCFTLMVLF